MPALAKRTRLAASVALRACLLASVSLSLTGCLEFQEPVEDELGDADRCAALETWEGDWSRLEQDMVLAVSALRGMGGQCGDAEPFGRAPAVVHVPELRCAAREHAAFLARKGRLSHLGSNDRDTATRLYDAGYTGIPRGELIARGELDPEAVIAAWLEDEDSCNALLDRELDEVGAGLRVKATGDVPYWVLTLGTRRD